jgi:hypothetical protein
MGLFPLRGLRRGSPVPATRPSTGSHVPTGPVAALRHGVAARVATTGTGTASEPGQDRRAGTTTPAPRRERDRKAENGSSHILRENCFLFLLTLPSLHFVFSWRKEALLGEHTKDLT